MKTKTTLTQYHKMCDAIHQAINDMSNEGLIDAYYLTLEDDGMVAEAIRAERQRRMQREWE